MSAIGPIVPSCSFHLDLSARGYQVLFRADETNHCPGCGHSQWFVGRISAECGICGTALALAETEHAGLNPTSQKAVALHLLDGKGRPRRGDQRRDERHAGDERVIALHLDGSPHAFAIRNISAGGLMGQALPGLAEAGSVLVELEDGTMLPAELRWSEGDAVGLAFLIPAQPGITLREDSKDPG